MISNAMYSLGAKRSCIRELFEYGIQQAKVVGKENVMDFSIGNPSIPSLFPSLPPLLAPLSQ